jgi:ArsR family transcriptional regulator, arsenate/arsenite/antimonite-responsive transcriptional repressor
MACHHMRAVKLRRERTTPASGEDERIAQLAKALSHPARVQIIRTLLRRKTCIGCDIVEEIGLAASTTSEHLRILKDAGLITGEIERPRVCYSLSPAALKPLAAFVNHAAAAPPPNS